MPNTHTTLTSLFSDIADAIRGKTGSSATIVADNFPTAIANIPTGGGSPNIQSLSVTTNGTYTAPTGVDGYSPVAVNVSGGGGGGSATDPVRFIDYDGTILHSYSAGDFANLAAMPGNPTHTGLTSQGWNWTLADAKAQVTAMGGCDIGQMYVTDDGKTRVYISLVDSARLSPYLGICPDGTVVVDWGDNSATDTLTGSSLTTVQRAQHTYASTGDYVITLTVTSGSFAIYGDSTMGSYLLTRADSGNSSTQYYRNAIQKVELGASVSIGDYAFFGCFSLTSITMPSGVTSIGIHAFFNCYSLISLSVPSNLTIINDHMLYSCESLVSVAIPKSASDIANYALYGCHSLVSLAIPSGVTSIGTYAFYSCSALASLAIPSGVTNIRTYAFYNCRSLKSLTIPSGVTSIGTYVFYECRSLASITIPSSLTGINNSVFYNCQSLASLTIPSGVSSIAAYAFQGCSGIAEYHFLRTTPPTLANSNAFSGISSDCKIYVPSAALSNYKAASNWATYASYMVGE